MSLASVLARARLSYLGPRVPTIAPAQAVNRAKHAEGIPAPDTDPLSPNGVARVNGAEVAGKDTPFTPLPEGLTAAARTVLEQAGLTTLERALALSDEALLALDGVGPKTLELLRRAGE